MPIARPLPKYGRLKSAKQTLKKFIDRRLTASGSVLQALYN